MTYQLKNQLLAHLGDWALDPGTLQKVKSILPNMKAFYTDSGKSDPVVIEIDQPLKEIYSIPIFSEAFCKIMRDEIENIKSVEPFVPNSDEDELRQIPEFILHLKSPIIQ